MAKKKSRDFKANLQRAEDGFGYHQQNSVLLDMPYLEDTFVQDLTKGAMSREQTKQGWRPTMSKWTTHMKPNTTRPAIERQIEEQFTDDDDAPTDDRDWKESMIFGGGIGVGRKSI